MQFSHVNSGSMATESLQLDIVTAAPNTLTLILPCPGYHSTYADESIFLKSPFIAADDQFLLQSSIAKLVAPYFLVFKSR